MTTSTSGWRRGHVGGPQGIGMTSDSEGCVTRCLAQLLVTPEDSSGFRSALSIWPRGTA